MGELFWSLKNLRIGFCVDFIFRGKGSGFDPGCGAPVQHILFDKFDIGDEQEEVHKDAKNNGDNKIKDKDKFEDNEYYG